MQGKKNSSKTGFKTVSFCSFHISILYFWEYWIFQAKKKRLLTLNRIPENIFTFDDVIDVFFISFYTKGRQEPQGPKMKSNNWWTSSLKQVQK